MLLDSVGQELGHTEEGLFLLWEDMPQLGRFEQLGAAIIWAHLRSCVWGLEWGDSKTRLGWDS